MTDKILLLPKDCDRVLYCFSIIYCGFTLCVWKSTIKSDHAQKLPFFLQKFRENNVLTQGAGEGVDWAQKLTGPKHAFSGQELPREQRFIV